MRTFIALPLPDPVLDRLEALQATIATGRFVPRENLHLTLAFLDEQPVDLLEDLHAELEAIAVPPFPIGLGGLGGFGGDRPRALFVGAASTTALIGLHRRVRSAIRSVGIALPRERFRPHVTIARFRNHEPPETCAKLAWALRVHSAFAIEPFAITQFSLMRSRLTPDGPLYDALSTYPLAHDGLIHWHGSAPEDV